MRKIIYSALLVSIGMFLMSCGSSPQRKIIGKWVDIRGGMMEFFKDGTVMVTSKEQAPNNPYTGKPLYPPKLKRTIGKYSFSDRGYLKIYAEEEFAEKTILVYEVSYPSRDKLILTISGFGSSKFRRIK